MFVIVRAIKVDSGRRLDSVKLPVQRPAALVPRQQPGVRRLDRIQERDGRRHVMRHIPLALVVPGKRPNHAGVQVRPIPPKSKSRLDADPACP